MTVKLYGETHNGLRRSKNEDAFATRQTGPCSALIAVADGVGGENGGEVASRLAVNTLVDTLGHQADITETQLLQAVAAANGAVRARQQQNAALERMASTLVTATINKRQLTIAHLGDSRAYRFRQGELTQLTQDHTVAEDLHTQGLTIEPGMEKRYSNILTQGLGLSDHVEPSVYTDTGEAGDWYVFCSDGLSSYVPAEILKSGLAHTTPREIAQSLIGLALDHGGPDNITVVVLHIEGETTA